MIILQNTSKGGMNISQNTSACSTDIVVGLRVFSITMLVLILLNIIFHSVGCCLLIRLYKNGRENVQQVYLINLSITHSLGNIFQLLLRISMMIPIPHRFACTHAHIQNYLIAILFTVFTLSYYLSMTYITIDKVLDILLNIRYPVYWNERKAKHLVQLTWLVGILVCLVVLLLYIFHIGSMENIADVFFKYFYPAFDFGFILLSVISYSFIFHKYKQSRRLPPVYAKTSSIEVRKEDSFFKIFRTSKFYIGVMLVASFLLLFVVPDMVYLFYGVIGGNKGPTLDDALLIFYNSSYLVDAWIYIFAQRPVRQLLRRKITVRCSWISKSRTKFGAARTLMQNSIKAEGRSTYL